MARNTNAMTMTMAAGAALCAAATGGVAVDMHDAPVALTKDSNVSVRFVNSDAGATGSLYFLGWGQGESITYSASSHSNNLGQFLFSNKGTPTGTTIDLGVFDAGAALHFAYIINKGAGAAKTGDVIRSDIHADLAYFAPSPMFNQQDENFVRIGLEDIRDPKKSDWDFNDVIFDVLASPIPGPGAFALAMMGMAIAAPRRRRPC